MAARGQLELAELKSDQQLETAREFLRRYQPWSEEQASIRDSILEFAEHHEDAALRSCVPGHLTASALVLDSTGTRALLTHHRKLERWLQLGGHCDGETNLARAALIEAIEESGISDLRIDPSPIDVDIHTIPARKSEPEHLHLDTRFVVWAPAGATEICSEESIALRWIELAEFGELDTDQSVKRLAALVSRSSTNRSK
ncbi:MAG: 8-oxo-dGTP pyrophosphatase MutT (NUDIX family) [Planctomycetota bacterium]|jgi:8-oxo-dGTP pyrophosphatase MutT (NUDIX family)